jgi:hypothetical protein
MKILKGSLTETRYAWPTVDLNNSEARPLQLLSKTNYQVDQTTYMSDKLGLHRISNPDPNDYAVSLHRKFSRLNYTWITAYNAQYTLHRMRLYTVALCSTRQMENLRT